MEEKIGLGGGCHWCTEAVFLSLKGVSAVAQGYIASTGTSSGFSEGVIVTYNPNSIDLDVLIEIHLITHKSSKNHSMRAKYRSAIYTFSNTQKDHVARVLASYKSKYKNLITQILHFKAFKPSREDITNYYYKNPEKPFCEAFINPKLKRLLEDFSDYVDHSKLSHLQPENA